MKPCSKNRKHIAWLALDALDFRRAQDLRTHLQSCEGCRRYLREMSNLTQKLTMAETKQDVEASASFHQRVVGALRADETDSVWATLVERLHGTLNWRMALPVIGAAAVLIVALAAIVSRPSVHSDARSSARAGSMPHLTADPPPTIANYTLVANQSLEKLDELLTRQGSRNFSPTPIYTASRVWRLMTEEGFEPPTKGL